MSSRKKQQNSWVSQLAFLLYCGLMLWLLFGQRMDGGSLQIDPDTTGQSVNLTPFATLRLYGRILQKNTNPALVRHAIINLVGNVVMFVPLGLLTPCIWGKMRKFWVHFLYMVLVIVAVEVLQLVTLLGSCDVDDLLLNLVGTTIGYLLWRMIFTFSKKRK